MRSVENFTEYPINVMAVGDFLYIGPTKSRRQSHFARWDARLYTPILALAISHRMLYVLA